VTIPSTPTASPVTANGIIDILVPAAFVKETFCENERTSGLLELSPGSFQCVTTDIVGFSVKGFTTIATGTIVKILGWM
jgi:hypothetical protein